LLLYLIEKFWELTETAGNIVAKGWEVMKMEQRILFGVDDSDFALQAVAAMGRLLRNSKNQGITLFHGARDVDVSLLSRALHLTEQAIKEYRRLFLLEEQKVLDRARDVLIKSGLGADKLDTVLEEKCNHVAESMLRLAASKGFKTLALARWGTGTVGRQVMGSVTYRLAQMAEDVAMWVIDPRIASHEVLLTVVGAPISHRVMDYAVRYFAHLRDSRFTFFHVIPPLPPQYWDPGHSLSEQGFRKQPGRIDHLMKEYVERVKGVMGQGKERLIQAGVPEQNVVFKIQAQQRGIARDILAELEQGHYGILLVGRKGSKEISRFGLGSKANKLLHGAQALVICLVP
jgi:nucleotide-binding universal stress UspA family protein